jgi:2-C-methyl-D-erythritol 4-phosphate cytidylyltransferase/2-C-methyl-D-erythritol 2,4-cyclodiphosphate synthase
MRVAVIIVAAGRGERLGGDRPKQLLELGGRSLLERSVRAFDESHTVTALVVVKPADLVANPPAFLSRLSKPIRIAVGGTRRQDSVANGFAAVEEDVDVVVVHDAARPFVSQSLLSRTIDAARESGAAIAAIPVSDTVKQAQAEGDIRTVTATLPRDTIFLAQTPQAFRRDVLQAAIALGNSGVEATDEAALAERAGFPVRLVAGELTNIKVTTPEDLPHARRIAGEISLPGRHRTGAGYDLHRLVSGRPFIVGGVTIPFPRGPVGHSDADPLCHAVTDAILGAAAAGDIGRHFPDNDPRWKDASSLDLLARAARIVTDAGFIVENVDAVVIVQEPKLAPHIDQMRANLAKALEIDIERVGVKGKTNEGVGAIGRGEAIAVHAVALITAIPEPGT